MLPSLSLLRLVQFPEDLPALCLKCGAWPLLEASVVQKSGGGAVSECEGSSAFSVSMVS